MRELNHPSRKDLRLDVVLAALSDRVRRYIACHLADLAQTSAPVCSTFDVPVSKSTATYHFRVLREAGVIRQEYQGTTITNTLRRDDLEVRFPGLLQAVFDAQHAETGFHGVSDMFDVPPPVLRREKSDVATD